MVHNVLFIVVDDLRPNIPSEIEVMGLSVRDDRWRYTEWVRWNGTALAPIWSELKAAELYDHEGDDGAWTDPDRFENVNVVASTDKQLVAALSKQMHAAFGFPDN